MSDPRALRIHLALRARLAAIQGAPAFTNTLGDRIYLGREDLFADQPTFPCATTLEGEEVELDRSGDRVICELPITIHAATTSDPREPLKAGHLLLADVLRALFPTGSEDGYGADRLGGECSEFTYQGRDILPRQDGGKTTSVFVDVRVRYVLDLTDPTA